MTEQKGEQESKKPPWLKVKAPGSPEYLETRAIVRNLKLHTVCQEAHCPNIGECWSHSTATFLIMGDTCTRHCRFCAIKKGLPKDIAPLDPDEPEHVGIAVGELKLKHAVVTSVDRDDLPDGGASHFAKTVQAIHTHAPQCKVELLIPDLSGNIDDLKRIMDTGVDILNHNVETVPSLYSKVRPFSSYERSLAILRAAKELDPQCKTKSGIMVGLGEKKEEVLAVMDDLRRIDLDIMTIGQYLQPTQKQVPVEAYITPSEFEDYEHIGLGKGFLFVESGSLVRSSYHAWKHTQSEKTS